MLTYYGPQFSEEYKPLSIAQAAQSHDGLVLAQVPPTG